MRVLHQVNPNSTSNLEFKRATPDINKEDENYGNLVTRNAAEIDNEDDKYGEPVT